jgi:anthranilate phosphoribosyltransferase
MLRKYIKGVVEGRSLSASAAAQAMKILMSGEVSSVQIAAFAVALRMKGESSQEIYGFARAMRAQAVKLEGVPRGVTDTCGTGGDSLSTLNVSTLSALVAAGAGLKIAKHGNRSVSSRCGSADLLEALGVRIDLSPERCSASLREIGIAFLFAPRFHPALRHAAAARAEMGIRSFFNLLGPLCNPARANRQLMGIYDGTKLRMMAEAARKLGVRRGLIVNGKDGMDEITLTGPTRAIEIREGKLRRRTIRPWLMGLKRRAAGAFRGGGPEQNRKISLQILEGRQGARRDLVLINSGAALFVGGMARTIKEGVTLAAESLDSGMAAAKLADLRRFSRASSP